MKKEILYHYLGVNGTILSPVYLEGIYSVKKVKLTAESGKRLTKDFINKHINFLTILLTVCFYSSSFIDTKRLIKTIWKLSIC